MQRVKTEMEEQVGRSEEGLSEEGFFIAKSSGSPGEKRRAFYC